MADTNYGFNPETDYQQPPAPAPGGLQERYIVKKRDGQDDPRAKYFVLRYDGHGEDQVWVKVCRLAIRFLANKLFEEGHLLELAHDLLYATQDDSQPPSPAPSAAVEIDPDFERLLAPDDGRNRVLSANERRTLIAAVRQLAAENERLNKNEELNTIVVEQINTQIATSVRERDAARDELAKLRQNHNDMYAVQQKDYWSWMDNGEDKPESFGNGMRIVVRGEVMRRMAASEARLAALTKPNELEPLLKNHRDAVMKRDRLPTADTLRELSDSADAIRAAFNAAVARAERANDWYETAKVKNEQLANALERITKLTGFNIGLGLQIAADALRKNDVN